MDKKVLFDYMKTRKVEAAALKAAGPGNKR
jgi:hypothetical protein